jgi:hypothetical protein
MRHLIISAPDQLQGRLKGFPSAQFVATAQDLGPDALGRPDARGR